MSLRGTARLTNRTVLPPTDFSDASDAALESGKGVAERFEAPSATARAGASGSVATVDHMLATAANVGMTRAGFGPFAPGRAAVVRVGPAPALTAEAIGGSTRLIDEDRAWMDGRRVALAEAARPLEERVCAL